MKTLKILLATSILIFVGCKKKSVQLEISSNIKGAIVYIEGDSISATPTVINIYPGIIKLSVKKEGFVDYYFTDTVQNDTALKIEAILYTKAELEKIEEEKRRAEFIKKQKQEEEKLFNSSQSGMFTDFRDEQKYKWIKIGEQIWMAENLAYEIETEAGKCWAYNNSPANVKTYGYLYNWEAAKNACPEGWHLPSVEEWQKLITFLGGDRRASKKIREQGYSHWVDGYYYRPIATNTSGFTALPGGQRNDKGEFITLGTYSNWWSSTESGTNEAICYWMGYMSDFLNSEKRGKNSGFSVRCIKN